MTIADAANTLVPSILALKALGFVVECVKPDMFRALRGDEVYIAQDPVRLLGLVKLVEARGWRWTASDAEIAETIREYALDTTQGAAGQGIGPDGRAPG
jgi:hypothetical protein